MNRGVADRLSKISSTITSQFAPSEKESSTTMTDYKFYGWVGKDKNSIGNLSWEEFEPKTWTEDDVDIKISTLLN
jgi:hypothetical protein